MQALTHSRSRSRAPREISLLRKSVGALAAGRHHCWHCQRTPLVGEHVHLYGDRLVCELCRHLRREAPRVDGDHALARARSGGQAEATGGLSAAARTPDDAGRPTRLAPAVDPVTNAVTIDRPRDEVFDYLSDIANHPEFSDHYLKDWRLTRVDSVGRGAGARFRLDAPFQRFGWADMTFIEVEPPYRSWRPGAAGSSTATRPSPRGR
jgi:hypothetical protein